MILTITVAPTFDITYKIPVVVEHSVNRVESASIESSGKGINVSRALADMGFATVAIAPVADSLLGDYWIDLLRPHFAVARSRTTHPVRIHTSIVDRLAVTKLNENAPRLSEDEIADLIGVIGEEAKRHKPSWIVLAGSIHGDNAQQFGAGVADIARKSNAKLAVDSSGAAMIELLKVKPDFVKPNLDELLEIYPEMESSRSAHIEHVLKLSQEIDGVVLCTDGGNVAFASDGKELLEIIPPTFVGANSVGAGDASLAGYLAAESTGNDFSTSIQMAMSWASAACRTAGTAGLKSPVGIGTSAKITSLTIESNRK